MILLLLLVRAFSLCVNTNSTYNCPQSEICTNDYAFCPFISTTCPTETPFQCANGNCVLTPTTGCCDARSYWCPHNNKCVSSQSQCCSLNTTTPIYCKQTSTCVQFEFECCSNYLTYPTQNAMVKCLFENKCVPANTAQFCFQPFNASCSQYQCPDGKCVTSAVQCASQRVCPPGYFMCPDYSCWPGLAQFPLCQALKSCTIQSNLVARCMDGVTCTDDIQQCPSQVTCPSGQVLCPDNSCKLSAKQCVQAPAGPPPLLGSCGPGQIRCQNGECQSDCLTALSQNCSAQKMVQCPNTFQCSQTYSSCPTQIYCPLLSNYTFSLKSIICDAGPQICTWDQQRCRKSSCASQSNYFNVTSPPWTQYSPALLNTCPDGRCSQYDCMTQVSCSRYYQIKSQITGYFCTNTTAQADQIAEIAFQLQALRCPSNLVTCLSGHCRPTVYDCPQFITCPQGQVLCQDGQCVTDKDLCMVVDAIVATSIQSCTQQGLILCQSDMQTCVTSVELCPTMSSCPFGYTKCLENKCVLDWTCANDLMACSAAAPVYCRATSSCVSQIQTCPKLTVCPKNAPIKCATDQSCQKSITLCPPVSGYAVIATQLASAVAIQNCSLGSLCQNNSCQLVCPEWTQCQAGQVKCWDGRCASSQQLCPNSLTGCPFQAPYFCPYSAKCVSNQTACPNSTLAAMNLNTTCQANFGSSYQGCQLGTCSNQSCVNQTTFQKTCATWYYPNDVISATCYQFQCPPLIPIKCPNGLCVNDRKKCPMILSSAQQINNCTKLSNATGQAVLFPCLDGSCVTSQDQCPPIYDCAYNRNNQTIRCNDGTCKSSLQQCMQRSFPNCTYRCQNGQCANNKSYCFNENGCMLQLPYRCEVSGQCMLNSSACATTVSKQLALMPYQKSTNICESKGLFTCITSQAVYCVTSLSMCYQTESGCPVTAPVLCAGSCVASITNCAIVTTPQVNTQGCPSKKPFRCSQLSQASCAYLPFTQDYNLFNYTCAASMQALVGMYVINKCSSALSPYSCADGSCVSVVGSCQTCQYFCLQMMACTANKDECTAYGLLKFSKVPQTYQQQCPLGTPIRCVLSGECVQDTLLCIAPVSAAYNQAFQATLIDPKCPSQTPILCQSGQCVQSADYCVVAKMSLIQMSQPNINSALPCQVVCADGSCRDNQFNCPLAQACTSPLKPYRCLNGICAQDESTCVVLFGTNELESRSSLSGYCTSKYGGNYVRCEDGTCRPATLNGSLYQSSCLAYYGCPVDKPLQCPTGQCVRVITECLQYSNQALCSGLYMCKNMACVKDPQQCNIDLRSLQVLELSIDVSPYQEYSVAFVYNNSLPVMGIKLPVGAVNTTENVTFTQDTLQKLNIHQVFGQYTTVIQPAALAYVAQRFNIVNGELDSYQALLSPLAEIEILLAKRATLYFTLDVPTCMDFYSDLCLAQLQPNNSLTCVSRALTMSKSQVSVQIKSQGTFAIIFSPDMTLKTISTPLVPTQPTQPETIAPPVVPDSQQCESWKLWCDYKWWVIGISIAILILLLGLVIYCLTRRKSTADMESVRNQHKYPPVQQTDASDLVEKVENQFKQELKSKDLQIQELEAQLQKASEFSSRVSTNTPVKQLEQFDFYDELRMREDKIKYHYRSEVLKVAVKLQKEAEEQGLTPPRMIRRPLPEDYTKLEDYHSDVGSEQALTEQWNKLVTEYQPPKELLSQSQRPYFSEIKSIRSKSPQDSSFKPRKVRIEGHRSESQKGKLNL